MEGENHHLRVGEAIGQRDRRRYGLLPRPIDDGFTRVTGTTATFDAPGHAVESFHALHRVFSHAGFAAEHDGIRLLVNGVGHVGYFRAGRKRVGDHRLEHVGGNDDRFADLQAGFDDAALDDGKFFHRAFNPEIPAGHHHGIRGIDDFLDVFHRVLVLDFGDDVGVTSEAL